MAKRYRLEAHLDLRPHVLRAQVVSVIPQIRRSIPIPRMGRMRIAKIFQMIVLLWVCWRLGKRVNSYSHVLTVAEGLGTFVMVTRSPQATTSALRHDGTAAPQKDRLGLPIKELLSAVHVNIIWATVAVAGDCRLVHLPPGDSG